MQGFPRLGELISEAKKRKEVWAWDGVVPWGQTTLVAGFMKKGKTTLLTGLVNGWLKTGMYCGRGTQGVRRVLYLAPEEGDTLVRRFERLGFGAVDEPALTVLPRAHPMWAKLITSYRMREWTQVVAGWKAEGVDTIVLDGLHTLLHLFEPQAKEDNEGVTQFLTQFVAPLDGMTVVAALHTKKGGGDPRVNIPPEEMIRGASAWMATVDQILVMEHMRKEDLKRFHAFGRHEGSRADGWVIRYSERTHDYEEVEVDGNGDPAEQVVAMNDDARIVAAILQAVRGTGEVGLTIKELEAKVTARKGKIRPIAEELSRNGKVRLGERAPVGGGRPATVVLEAVGEEANDEE